MLSFSETAPGVVKVATTQKTYASQDGFRMVQEKTNSITPPITQPGLHAPKQFKSRHFEGGTLEEALPQLELAILEGCLAYWNTRQYTEADIELHKGLLELGDRIGKLLKKPVKRASPKKTPAY